MATPARHLCRSIFQVGRSVPVKRKCLSQAQSFARQHRVTNHPSIYYRQLSTTVSRRADTPSHTSAFDRDDQAEEDEEDLNIDINNPPKGGFKTPNHPITLADLDEDDLADYNMLSPKDQTSWLALQNHYVAEFEAAGIDAMADPEGEQEDPVLDKAVDDLERSLDKEIEPLDFPEVPLDRKFKNDFWQLDEEDDEFAYVEDAQEDWDESALTSIAQGELDLHREIRQYTRVIAWDMPLLQKFAKPFEPPTESTPLRFRYTTYLGEFHPASRKVVLQFSPEDLPDLTEQQRLKFLKLVGPRYNPSTSVVKMSCEQFEAPAQNKRYLGDQVKKLLDEARNSEDTFEDIPLDLRHHKPKRRVQFPEGWKLNNSRLRQLQAAREEQKLLDEGQTILEKQAVDGAALVHEYARVGGRQMLLRS